MLILLAIAFILIALIFISANMKNLRHKLRWVLLLIVCLILYTTFLMSISGQNIEVFTTDGMKEASGLYFSWLRNALRNLGTITGNAIRMDWGIKNPFS